MRFFGFFMFTGLVQALFPVVSLKKKEGMIEFSLLFTDELLQGLVEGASVSVDGVCLTVVCIKKKEVFFQVVQETLIKTTLNELFLGRFVNVERSLKMGQEIGGHLLSGHVLEKGMLLFRKETVNNCCLTVQTRAHIGKYLLEKGYIAVDGVSLTVTNKNYHENANFGTFEVHLIPETLKRTTLGVKSANDEVNIEIDAQMQRTVEAVERYFLEKGKSK